MAITPERLAQLRKELFGRLYRLKPADENQNFAAKFREAQKEIDRLTRERDEARAACEALREYVEGPIVYVTDTEIAARQVQRDGLLAAVERK